MVHHIKMDRETALAAQTTIDKQPMQPKNNTTVEAVSVSTHLSQLANQMQPENEMPSGASVEELKQQIQSGQYSVDFNALSDKLLKSGVLS